MAASQATMEANPTILALEMASQMEALAANGDWQRTEALVARIKEAVRNTPEAERRQLLSALGQSLQRVQTFALTSRHEVTEKLSEIRRGRVATRAYGQPSDTNNKNALR